MINNCIMCGVEKHWKSDIMVILDNDLDKVVETSVCPKCRLNHTIAEVFDKVAMDTIHPLWKEIRSHVEIEAGQK